MFGVFRKKLSAEDAAFEDIGKCGDAIINAAKSGAALGIIERDFRNTAAIASIVQAIGQKYPNLPLGPNSAFSVALGLIEKNDFDQLNQFVLEAAENLLAIKGYINRGLRVAEWYAGPLSDKAR